MWFETSPSYRNRRRYLFLWGNINNPVYDVPVETAEDLAARILAACETVQNTSGIFERVRQKKVRRCSACSEDGGRPFEQISIH